MSKRCLCGIFTVFNNSSICPLCGLHILELFDDVRLQIFRNQTGITQMNDDNLKEFFIKTYNNDDCKVVGMTDVKLIDHIKELELLACEVKANLKRGQDELRQRQAKLSVEQRSWLVTNQNPDQTVSDAIAAVKVRKERMSKGDKLIASLREAGLDDDFIANAERKLKTVTEATVNKFKFNPIPASVQDAVDAIEIVKSDKPVSVPFNPFAKKD